MISCGAWLRFAKSQTGNSQSDSGLSNVFHETPTIHEYSSFTSASISLFGGANVAQGPPSGLAALRTPRGAGGTSKADANAAQGPPSGLAALRTRRGAGGTSKADANVAQGPPSGLAALPPRRCRRAG